MQRNYKLNFWKMSLNIPILIFLFSLPGVITTLSVDPYDLLSGEGLFSSPALGNFTADTAHTTSFISVNSSNVLKLEKPSTSAVSFDSGLQYSFVASQPSHLSFQFSSISPNTEDTNLRLIDSSTGNTVLLFRAGKAGFIRVNENQMIAFYNSSVTESDANVTTVKMDILIDWTAKSIRVYVEGQFKGEATFFQTASTVDTLRLYNLYQSTSYWKNLVVCTSTCYSFSSASHVTLVGGAILILILMFFN